MSLATPAAGVAFDNPLLPALVRFDRRRTLTAALDCPPAHMAGGDPVDPDPSYTPRHRRPTP